MNWVILMQGPDGVGGVRLYEDEVHATGARTPSEASFLI